MTKATATIRVPGLKVAVPLAADALQKMGYTNVVSMDGGWSAWVRAGMPTEK